MKEIIDSYRKLISETPTAFHRYMAGRINWDNRLVGIVGPRGVGKTTLMLQHINENLDLPTTLYVTADHFYFASHHLLDLAADFAKAGGKFLFVDEIHKLPDWARELKLIYDLHSELRVVFSGSSVLNLTRGATADLSRRAVLYAMQGLSFREYLELYHGIRIPAHSLADILAHRVELPDGLRPLPHFHDYLRTGYYPFGLENNYTDRLLGIVGSTLEVDIPQYAGMNASMARKLKQLLAIVARSVPFKPNMTSIGQALGVSRNNVADYLLYVEEAGLISQLRNDTGGIKGLGKVDKVYLDNTNLAYTLAKESTDIGNIRETFFMNQTRVDHDVISSGMADFEIDGRTFEVGGRKKGKRQIADAAEGYVVRDDIEYGFGNVVPLWAFGFTY